MTPKLLLRHEGKVWWVTGLPAYFVDGEGPYTEVGPYDTRAEASETRDRLVETFRDPILARWADAGQAALDTGDPTACSSTTPS